MKTESRACKIKYIIIQYATKQSDPSSLCSIPMKHFLNAPLNFNDICSPYIPHLHLRVLGCSQETGIAVMHMLVLGWAEWGVEPGVANCHYRWMPKYVFAWNSWLVWQVFHHILSGMTQMMSGITQSETFPVTVLNSLHQVQHQLEEESELSQLYSKGKGNWG